MNSSVGTNNTTVPASIDVGPRLTDTVVQQSTQGITDAQPSQSSSAINAYGIKIQTGGQFLGIGLFDGISKAYSNLVYQPFAMVLVVISTAYYIQKLIQPNGKEDIFYLMSSNVVEKVKDDKQTVLIKALATLLAALFSYLHKYADLVAATSAMWFPYVAKPSTRNSYTSGLLTVFSLFFLTDYFNMLLLSHGFFLFTQLRSPQQKTIIALLVFVICIFGPTLTGNIVGIDMIKNDYGSNKHSSNRMERDLRFEEVNKKYDDALQRERVTRSSLDAANKAFENLNARYEELVKKFSQQSKSTPTSKLNPGT